MKHEPIAGRAITRTIKYIVCITLAILSVIPFWIMIMNATRGTYEIQQSAISLLPSTFLKSNFQVFEGKAFNPLVGFMNSFIIAGGATILGVYFSSLTAYALVAYQWRLRQPFFTFIMAVLMIPAQVSGIGFYQFMYRIGWTNSYFPLILPAIAAPAVVFFMRQYLAGALSVDIVNSARIDGAGEFYTFNRIVLPIMKPAMATQAIFSFVGSWNNLFMPLILLTDKSKYTMPIMVSLLRGDIYRTEYGAVYLGLTLTVLPLFIVYFALSKYIIAGVALGSMKE
ncbi:MAG: carbohydrate ABC transporter permease [Clostridiaceae bacterium]|jgi:multiple sugar transport system permease protein|nr:carbohydrate ABC transporter permease [Bacillota bacterium]NLI37779.1 carbohydrate ABC transporter permease [Clostridiaceae bacterium]